MCIFTGPVAWLFAEISLGHDYDAVQSGFSASYAVPFHRGFKEETGEVSLQYPIRFSGGIQQESFFNFPGAHSQQFRPYFNISLF